jgi:hypothetical protein
MMLQNKLLNYSCLQSLIQESNDADVPEGV